MIYVSPDDNTYQAEVVQSIGKFLGWSERFMVLIFILSEQYMAIGFLATAKQINIFLKKEQTKNREMFLFGTILSFSFAIAIGLLVHDFSFNFLTNIEKIPGIFYVTNLFS